MSEFTEAAKVPEDEVGKRRPLVPAEEAKHAKAKQEAAHKAMERRTRIAPNPRYRPGRTGESKDEAQERETQKVAPAEISRRAMIGLIRPKKKE